MARGTFIVIDGGDGAGKDTQIERLKIAYPDALFVRDPGSTPIGTEIREILQYGENLAKRAELFLFLASRNQLVETVIKPALESGRLVISNRFDLSTIAYQVYGRERVEMLEEVLEMSRFACNGIVPDLYILLDVPPEVGLGRLENRDEKLTRFEKEQRAFHERVRAGFLKHVAGYPRHAIVDGAQSEAAVAADIQKEIAAAART